MKRRPFVLTLILTLTIAFTSASPAFAKKKKEKKQTTDKIEAPAVPIIGDADSNGVVTSAEARALMQSPQLKQQLFNATKAEQSLFYNSLENKIRIQLLKMAKAYGTPRWAFVIERAEQAGLSASDAERIALVMKR